ncbi:MAG: hypothetical protein LRY73_10170 [Bacillus sp. (in: Bacteria)]|nr:hypothetical protein [Bacillus sp. (in: firmicutes)]
MASSKKKNINWRKSLGFLLTISIIINVIQYLNHNDYIHQQRQQHYNSLWIISDQGENLVNQLDKFLALTENDAKEELKVELDNAWRIAFGQHNNMHWYSAMLSSELMGRKKSEWSMLQYSFNRINQQLQYYNSLFHERNGYVLDEEEREKLAAIASFYRIYRERTKGDSIDIDSMLAMINEPMMVIDENYSNALTRVGLGEE